MLHFRRKWTKQEEERIWTVYPNEIQENVLAESSLSVKPHKVPNLNRGHKVFEITAASRHVCGKVIARMQKIMNVESKICKIARLLLYIDGSVRMWLHIDGSVRVWLYIDGFCMQIMLFPKNKFWELPKTRMIFLLNSVKLECEFYLPLYRHGFWFPCLFIA